MNSNWYTQKDLDTPYKAIYTVKKEKDGKEWHVTETARFSTKEEALAFFDDFKGRCLISNHDFHEEETKFIACKDK